MYIIILAGGEGSRLKPLSNKETPKPFLTLSLGETLLKRTVRRFVDIGLANFTYVITSLQYANRIMQELRCFNEGFDQRIIIEPCGKNTAPAVMWSIKELMQNRKIATEDDLIMMVPIDHIVSNDELFTMQLLRAGLQVGLEELLCFGLPSTRPISHYGYIEKGPKIHLNRYQVKQFIEKPSESKAKELMTKKCLWNLGIYVFTIRKFLKELSAQQQACRAVLDFPNAAPFYETIDPISIDNAVVTHGKELSVYELSDLKWFDVGTWDGLYALAEEHQKECVQMDHRGGILAY